VARKLNRARQLVVFEVQDWPFCKRSRAEVLDGWSSAVPVVVTYAAEPPEGWKVEKALFATPTGKHYWINGNTLALVPELERGNRRPPPEPRHP
jgi:hypothetical protein